MGMQTYRKQKGMQTIILFVLKLIKHIKKTLTQTTKHTVIQNNNINKSSDKRRN